MRTYQKCLILFLIPLFFASCNSLNKNGVSKKSFFKGIFKAKEVKEGTVVVYREGSSNNIIPAYVKYRIAFSTDASGKRSVKITEYTGEVFSGIWTYDDTESTLVFSSLSPRPASGDFKFDVISKCS